MAGACFYNSSGRWCIWLRSISRVEDLWLGQEKKCVCVCVCACVRAHLFVFVYACVRIWLLTTGFRLHPWLHISLRVPALQTSDKLCLFGKNARLAVYLTLICSWWQLSAELFCICSQFTMRCPCESAACLTFVCLQEALRPPACPLPIWELRLR